MKEHMHKYVQPGSKVLCTFGFGSIDRNGARKDVEEALSALKCEVTWQGGICPNPEYDQLLEILEVIKEKKPDVLLAVGGGSVLDGTKFLATAFYLQPGEDPWKTIFLDKRLPDKALPIGAVMTLPATGSEWNGGFVVSRHATREKLAAFGLKTFPVFSLLDPRYTMTLPVRQLRNGVYDALIHCIDRYVTTREVPMFDDFYLSVCKELIAIGPDVIKEGSSIELRERLIVAALFAINGIFSLPKPNDRGIHIIGHMLTVKWGIDHAATLSIVTAPFLQNQIKHKKKIMAKSAEVIFGVTQGSDEEKAQAFVDGIKKFTIDLGMPFKASDWPGVKVEDGDVDDLVQLVMNSTDGQPFGVDGCVTSEDTKWILEQSII